MKKTKDHYKIIDNKIKINKRNERLSLAIENGYESIAEHVVETYKKEKSLKRTGDKCLISPNSVKKILNNCNENLRSRGGAKKNILSESQIDKYIMPFKINNRTSKIISSNILNDLGIYISASTIKSIYLKKTRE